MLAKVITWLIRSIMVLLGLLLIVFILYFIHGSLELYPTEAQHEQSRTASGFLMTITIITEAILYICQRKLSQFYKNRSRLQTC